MDQSVEDQERDCDGSWHDVPLSSMMSGKVPLFSRQLTFPRERLRASRRYRVQILSGDISLKGLKQAMAHTGEAEDCSRCGNDCSGCSIHDSPENMRPNGVEHQPPGQPRLSIAPNPTTGLARSAPASCWAAQRRRQGVLGGEAELLWERQPRYDLSAFPFIGLCKAQLTIEAPGCRVVRQEPLS